MPNQKKVTLDCGHCGESFTLYRCQTLNGRGKYCSRKCAGLARRTGDRLTCHECGVAFYRRAGEQRDTVNPFCSRSCYTRWRAKNRKASSYVKVDGRHEHRAVAEGVLGRSLRPGEVVHHIDENKHNNAPDNLAVLPNQSEHARLHFGDMSEDEFARYRLCGQAKGEKDHA